MTLSVSELIAKLQEIESLGRGNVGVYWYAWNGANKDGNPRKENWGVAFCNLRHSEMVKDRMSVWLGIDDLGADQNKS